MPSVHDALGLLLPSGALLWALAGEASRLPPQNVVALAALSLAGSAGVEWSLQQLVPGTGANLAGANLGIVVTSAAWLLSARSLARLPSPRWSHLFLRTVGFALVVLPAGPWPSRTPGALALRAVMTAFLLLLLAPWWINKQLRPRPALPGAAWAFPGLFLGLTLLACLEQDSILAGARILVVAASAAWILTRPPTPAPFTPSDTPS